jgi:hypothetical protein
MAMEIEKDTKISASVKARYLNIGKILEFDPKGGCTVEVVGYVNEDDYRNGLSPVLVTPVAIAFGEPLVRPPRAVPEGEAPEPARVIPSIPKAIADAFIAAAYQAIGQMEEYRDAIKV